ncbi:MAG: hypothetical protein KC731_36400 [Myxococcales bacterium]|nr:hypothetical protein [Myxococcales bacterium]
MRVRRCWFAPLVLAVLSGCHDSEEPATVVLNRAFPDHADEVIGAEGFERGDDGWVAGGAWRSLSVSLPDDASRGITMTTRSGSELSVREAGATGAVSEVPEGGALQYRAEHGTAFWRADAIGVEEWLLLPDGVADERRPVATWQVEGGELTQAGSAVRIDLAGEAPIWVRADEAYGPNQRPLRVSLQADGDHLRLYVEASPGPVLVDPSWGNMGTLVNARASFGMSLLLNGQVFVVGGETSGFPMATAERYDPISGVWAAATPLPSGPRSWPVATTLLNGDVLVTGGWTGIQSLFDADVYVTSTNSWTSKPGMGLERAGHTAVRLNDGRVLVCGGAGGSIPSLTEPEGGSDQAQDPGPVNAAPFGGSSGFGGLDDCEIYDPSFNGGDWTMQVFMNDWRHSHDAAKLNDGRVLVVGGEDGGFYLSSADIFNPLTNSFSATSSMNDPRSGHTATTLGDGRVLVVGGEDLFSVLDSTEIYNPQTGLWSQGPLLSTPRTEHTASLLGDGSVLVVGGYNQNGALAGAEIFDPISNTWSATDPIPTGRSFHSAASFSNGTVIAAGGYDNFGNAVSSSYIFSVAGVNGTPCVSPSSCISGFCVDGVCCDTACNATCEACTLALKGGGLDGTCGAIASGTDPDGECGAGMCMGDDLDPPDTCNGAGSCADPGLVDCGTYTCQSAACLTSCITSAQCAGDAYCGTTGMTCLPKKGNGQTATTGEECLSGFVADGVCCDTACDLGICDACTVMGGATADGTCTDVIGDCDDGNECTVSACDPAVGCTSASKLDGTLCGDGICVAGSCVPDSVVPTGSGGSTSSGGNPSGSGAGGNGDPELGGTPTLVGGGLCSLTGTSTGSLAGDSGRPASRDLGWLLVASAALWWRRRRDLPSS